MGKMADDEAKCVDFEVYQTKGKGLGLRCTRDIEIGYKILQDDPAVCIVSTNKREHFCHECFGASSELLRCSSCKFARYCGRTCQTKAWISHKTECKMIKGILPRIPTDLLRLMYKVLEIQLVNKTTPWLRQLVSTSDQLSDSKREGLMSICALLAQFSGKEFISRFSQSEIFEVFAKISCNSFSVCDGEMQPIGVALYPIASRLNHSCQPNCIAIFNGCQILIRTIKKLTCGDELTISYTELLMPAQIRHKELKDQYFFDCCCQENGDDWKLNSYKCANKTCKNIVSGNGQCDKCGTTRDTTQIPEVCTHIKTLLHDIKELKNDHNKKLKLCNETIKRYKHILSSNHYLLVALLDQGFDACVSASMWKDALQYGLETLDTYQHFYHPYHPNVAIQLFRVGKLQLYLEYFKQGAQSLQEALSILKVTHGEQHCIVQQLKELIASASEEYRLIYG